MNKRMKDLLNLMGVVIVLSFAIPGIVWVFSPRGPIQTTPVSAKSPIQPTNFGNGVYYFEARGEHFGNSLSFFSETKNCKIKGSASNNVSGNTVGYFVICY